MPSVVYVSRDEVRSSMLGEDDDYFAKENAVFKEFIRRINEAIDNPNIEAVIADATHLNWASRNKTINHLHLSKVEEVIPVIFNTPLNVCLDRNSKREGRARVPDAVVRQMYNRKTDPHNDPFHYADYVEIKYKNE